MSIAVYAEATQAVATPAGCLFASAAQAERLRRYVAFNLTEW